MLQPMNAVNPFPQMEAGWGFSAYHVASYDEEIVTVKKLNFRKLRLSCR